MANIPIQGFCKTHPEYIIAYSIEGIQDGEAKLKIAVIDGQGGGIGSSLVAGLREHYGEKVEILAIGTNVQATSSMLKAGADLGATGENAIIVNAAKVDIIAGPIGIILANSMLGELTPAMAGAIGESSCEKILVPIQKCRITIAGTEPMPMQMLITDAISKIEQLITPLTSGRS